MNFLRRSNRSRRTPSPYARVTLSVDFESNAVRPLTEFHRDPRYESDLHRADMAWAFHAASLGLPEQQIRDEILTWSDLSKKGSIRRQFNYARRTAIKAVRTVEPIQ